MSVVWRIFWWSLAFKLALAAVLPMTSDEAYYWVWAQFPQLSYYDHPPFVSWLYGIADFLDLKQGFVRWPGVLMAHLALALWLKVFAPFLNQQQLCFWLLLALLSPLLGGSGILVTPDVPLLFFYALSVFLFLKWQKKPYAALSLILGLTLGLGFSSKYMMVLFVISVLPVVLNDVDLRRVLAKNLPWIVIGGIVGALPVWLWNLMNDFVSIKFQTAHGLGRKFWKPSWTIEYVLLQVGLIFPVVLYWALRARKNLPVIFHWLSWTPLAFFLMTTSRGYVEGNWPITAYPSIFALAVSHWPRNSKWLKFTLSCWSLIFAVALILVLAPPDWSRDFKFKEFHQFDSLVETARPYEPLYARSYQMAAKLHFELQRPVFKLKGMNRKDFYDFLPQSEPSTKSFYWAVQKTDRLPEVFAQYQVTETIPVDDRYEIRRLEKP